MDKPTGYTQSINHLRDLLKDFEGKHAEANRVYTIEGPSANFTIVQTIEEEALTKLTTETIELFLLYHAEEGFPEDCGLRLRNIGFLISLL